MQETELARWQLRQRLRSLYEKLRHWHALSRGRESAFAANHSQIRAFSSALRAVGHQIKVAARREDVSVRELRMLTVDLLGLFRVWEYLRSKLAQRLDTDIASALRLADDFAWSCFQPVAKLSYREPPLVFLNGGYSPYMLPRRTAFQAEYVAGETQNSKVVRTLTSELPFPVIGLPWYQASAVWDLPLVGHEVGHAVEDDLKLDVASIVAPAIPGEARRKDWVRWAGEVFADYYGALATGAAFVSALSSFLAGMGRTTAADEYPNAALRFELNLSFVPPGDADRLRQRWAPEFSAEPQMAAYMEDCRHVATALAQIALPLKPLQPGQINKATMLADAVMRRRVLQGNYDDARVVVVAMRKVYDVSVEAGSLREAVQRAESLRTILSGSVKPETRALRAGAAGQWLEASRTAHNARKESWKKLLYNEFAGREG